MNSNDINNLGNKQESPKISFGAVSFSQIYLPYLSIREIEFRNSLRMQHGKL